MSDRIETECEEVLKTLISEYPQLMTSNHVKDCVPLTDEMALEAIERLIWLLKYSRSITRAFELEDWGK